MKILASLLMAAFVLNAKATSYLGPETGQGFRDYLDQYVLSHVL